ncbi:MAG: hypothetical protein HYT35_00310, partial [Candidatus Staskawiczbacteria bacterium]|nr:hypothetical protein [Candidatus Staskawiczbacteria bacterium]
ATTSNFSFPNNFTAEGVYLINVSVFDINFTTAIGWEFNITNNNRLANITEINLTSSDQFQRRNGTLTFSYAATDPDGQAITINTPNM